MRKCTHSVCFRANALICAGMALLVAGMTGFDAGAASMHESLAAAAAHLEKQEYDRAIEAYQQAQLEAPHINGIPYAIACASFAKAESLGGQDAEAAKTAYKNAQDTFQRVADVVTDNQALRSEARFGVAICVARAAELEAKPEEYLQSEDKAAVPQEEFKKRVAALRDGVKALDQYLAEHPDDQRASHNAERLRYFWKRMLQERPKPQYSVMILKTDTEYPQANAEPLPEEASVQLRVGAAESGP